MAFSSTAVAAQLEDAKPFSVDIAQDCRTVADAALPWLKKRGVQIDDNIPASVKALAWEIPYGIDYVDVRLTTTRMRAAHGIPIFNFNGKYVEGGKWHSFLTAPHVNGMDGEMTLKPKGPNACVLSLKMVYRTLIADSINWSTHRETITEFNPMPGPDVKSNGRLEREYASGIIKKLAQRRRTK